MLPSKLQWLEIQAQSAIFLQQVDELIDCQLKLVQIKKLQEVLFYAVKGGGKKFRPLLIWTIAKSFDVSEQDLIAPAAAVELIHAYSLAHDDLPAMDNASLRRGKPSCWAKFDQATAILAGDALLTEAFNILSNCKLPAETIVKLSQKLSECSGASGMVGGQFLDIQQNFSKSNNASENHEKFAAIKELQTLKTGELLKFCCVTSAIISQQFDYIELLNHLGEKIGLLYQIADDLLDYQDPNITGKNFNQDLGKATFISLLGGNIDGYVKQLMLECQEILQKLPRYSDEAAVLINWVITRKF